MSGLKSGFESTTTNTEHTSACREPSQAKMDRLSMEAEENYQIEQAFANVARFKTALLRIGALTSSDDEANRMGVGRLLEKIHGIASDAIGMDISESWESALSSAGDRCP